MAGVLTFCLVDPFRIENLDFGAIRRLANLKIDFFVLIPSFMDAGRNEATYTRADNPGLDRFLGQTTWRAAWANRKNLALQFGDFVRQEFEASMKALGFLVEQGASKIVKNEQGAKLYHLEVFSRHPRGEQFWRQALKYASPQRTFGWDT
jgi:three-Cys-motif partner protein